MKIPKLFSIKNSIATQLLKSVFSFYLILTILVTSIHLAAEFYNMKKQMNLEIQSIGNALKSGISQSLWDLDHKQLELTLFGIVQFPTVVGVQIDELGAGGKIKENFYSLGIIANLEGNTTETNSFQDHASVDHSGLFSQSFSLSVQEETYVKENKVGKMHIYSSTNIVLNKMKLGFGMILVNSIIKTAALWFLFLFIAQKKLAEPLAEFTRIAEKLSLDQLEGLKVKAVTRGHNELKILEEAFNSMIQKLIHSREKLKKQYSQLQQTQDQLVVVHKEFEEIPPVRCYPNQLYQVWTNLIHNAIQAMEGKGEIFLRLKRWSPDQIAVEVEDMGPGIPEELREKIFTPFHLQPLNLHSFRYLSNEISCHWLRFHEV